MKQITLITQDNIQDHSNSVLKKKKINSFKLLGPKQGKMKKEAKDLWEDSSSTQIKSSCQIALKTDK